MNLDDFTDGLADDATGDYYICGKIVFVFAGKVVGTWLDLGDDRSRRYISEKFWRRFISSQKIKESPITSYNSGSTK